MSQRHNTVHEWQQAVCCAQSGVYPEDAVKLLGSFPDPKAFKVVGGGVIAVGFVNLGLFIVAHQYAGLLRGTIAHWLALALAVGGGLLLGWIVYHAGQILEDAYFEVEAAAAPEIPSLSQRINVFARRQEKYRALTESSISKWQEWTRRNFKRMLEEWKPDIEEWEEISSHPRFTYAVKQWSLGGQKSSDLLQIWNDRMRIWQWAQFRDTSEERYKVKAGIGQTVEETDRLIEHDAEKLRDRLRPDDDQ